MTKTDFDIEPLKQLLDYSLFINVIDLRPDDACEFIANEYEGSIVATSKQIISEIKEAIGTKTLPEFRKKYCEAPFVIINLREEDAIKDALQFELVFMLNVRNYKDLPTVFVTAGRMSKYPFSNVGLIQYSNMWQTLR